MITTPKIIEQFNESIKHLQRAIDSSLQGDLPVAQTELGKSSICIYSCLEWCFKNYLLHKFPDVSKYSSEHLIISGSNFHNKFALFQKSVSPNFRAMGIDPKIISELRDTVRNQPEHSGYTPHYNSLIKVISETRKIIASYIDANATLENIPQHTQSELEGDSQWSEFYTACDSFDKSKNYILVIGPTSGFSEDKLSFLGLLEWSLIIDFNPKTEIDGFYKYAKEKIESKRKLHLLTNEDSISFSPYNSTYWLAANGLQGRQSTLTNDFRSWNRKYLAFLNKFITSYFQTFGDKPSDLIILWDNQSYIQKVCETINIAAGEKTKIIYAAPDLSKLSAVYDIYSGINVDISIPQIADGILRIRNFYGVGIDLDLYTLPAKDEEFIKIDHKDFLWFEEDFEVLHRNILDNIDISNDDLKDRERFYKGNQISWLGLHLHHDIDREKTNSIKKKIDKALRDREPVKYILHHYPGIGGTTLSRRVSWDIKDDYPVLILRNYRNQDTVEKIFKIFELTKKSILIIAEASVINIDDLHKLYNELLSRNFPFVFLLVQRSESTVSSTFTLQDLLTDTEFNTFIAKYKELCPHKTYVLDKILRSSERKERHPFYLGLATFEENFDGLDNFIERNISGATEIQRKIMSIIALCYFYGQKDVSAQMFTTLLMTPENSVVLLDRHLNTNLLLLLINEEDIKWRPLHYLVAQQLLVALLSREQNNKPFWKNNLTDLAISIIKLIADKSSIPSDSDTELLKRLFVYRDNQEILGKEEESKFSNFIENGLQTDEARLLIFLQLTESFPEESHFWAHLARFYSLVIKNHDKSLDAISKAIALSDENDSLLYHMKGMCLRAIAREKMNTLRGKKNSPKEQIQEIYTLIDEAGENFLKSREISPSNEHGYISHIQLLINVIDFSFSISKYESKTDFIRHLNIWLQEKLDMAEELLDNMKLQTQMKSHNPFVEKCDLDLQELYENFSLVIEGWNNLLSKANNNKPIIRRSIIRAYVRRVKSWDFVDSNDIVKILKLIEENIQEEPGNGHNIYLWFQAARQTDKIDINSAINKVSNWRAISEIDESVYYLGVLHAIQAIEGTSLSKTKAEKLIRELSEKRRNTPYRTHCFEWYGKYGGLKRLIPYKNAVSKNENYEFLFNREILERVKGKISFIKGPEAGNIELSCGLIAHFIPARGSGFSRDRDLNKNVNFYLGFSNDGLRAYEVELEN